VLQQKRDTLREFLGPIFTVCYDQPHYGLIHCVMRVEQEQEFGSQAIKNILSVI